MQRSKWKFRSVGTLLKNETRIYRQKMGKRYMNTVYIGKSSSLVLQPIIGLDRPNYAFPLVPVLNSGTKRSSCVLHRHLPAHYEHCAYVYVHIYTYGLYILHYTWNIGVIVWVGLGLVLGYDVFLYVGLSLQGRRECSTSFEACDTGQEWRFQEIFRGTIRTACYTAKAKVLWRKLHLKNLSNVGIEKRLLSRNF
jgi:hypothetical protein